MRHCILFDAKAQSGDGDRRVHGESRRLEAPGLLHCPFECDELPSPGIDGNSSDSIEEEMQRRLEPQQHIDL